MGNLENYAHQIGSFPLGRGENKKYLKPPPTWKFQPLRLVHLTLNLRSP